MRNFIEVVIAVLLLKLCFSCQAAYAIDKEMAIYFNSSVQTHANTVINYLRNKNLTEAQELKFRIALDMLAHNGFWAMDDNSFTARWLFQDYVNFCTKKDSKYNWDLLLQDAFGKLGRFTVSKYENGKLIEVPMPTSYDAVLECDTTFNAVNRENITTAGYKMMNYTMARWASDAVCITSGKGNMFDAGKLECVKR